MDEWLQGGLWKVNTFKSANKLWNLIDMIPDALGSQSWKTQSLVVEEESGHVN